MRYAKTLVFCACLVLVGCGGGGGSSGGAGSSLDVVTNEGYVIVGRAADHPKINSAKLLMSGRAPDLYNYYARYDHLTYLVESNGLLCDYGCALYQQHILIGEGRVNDGSTIYLAGLLLHEAYHMTNPGSTERAADNFEADGLARLGADPAYVAWVRNHDLHTGPHGALP